MNFAHGTIRVGQFFSQKLENSIVWIETIMTFNNYVTLIKKIACIQGAYDAFLEDMISIFLFYKKKKCKKVSY